MEHADNERIPVLKLTFLDVGQGDSILVEWKNDAGRWELGIIDCHYDLTKNSVANIQRHIVAANYQRITFLVLSHPHYDHFSGLGKLIEFCQQQGIAISSIYDSSLFHKHLLFKEKIHRRLKDKAKPIDLIATYVGGKNDRATLRDLLETFTQLSLSEQAKWKLIDDAKLIIDQKNLRMMSLAPSRHEFDEYLDRTLNKSQDAWIKPKRRNNTDANLLSTIFKIEGKNWQVILTSDALTDTIKRIEKDDIATIKPGVKLLVLQVPHHGSLANHAPEFWKKVIDQDTSAIISAGKNDAYKHPHFEVVNFYASNGLDVHATNFVYGYQEYFRKRTVAQLIDSESELLLIDQHLNTATPYAEDCGEKAITVFEDGTYEIITRHPPAPNRIQ